jgi:predicted nucleic acid-binding protein
MRKRAAVALRYGLRLVTRKARDFDEKKHAFVLIPYRLG